MGIFKLVFGIALIALALYLLGALSMDDGKITITTAVIKESAANAANKINVTDYASKSGNIFASILEKIRISITSRTTADE